MRKKIAEFFLMAAPEHYRLVKSEQHRTIFRNNSSFTSFKYKQHDKTSGFLLKSSRFINMEKVPTVPNLASKTLEIVSASKQKFYICNQKKLTLTKNSGCSPFR